MQCLVAQSYRDTRVTQEESTEKEIKKAFRTLSKQFHPDHNSSPEARERYKLVSTAYEVRSATWQLAPKGHRQMICSKSGVSCHVLGLIRPPEEEDI